MGSLKPSPYLLLSPASVALIPLPRQTKLHFDQIHFPAEQWIIVDLKELPIHNQPYHGLQNTS